MKSKVPKDLRKIAKHYKAIGYTLNHAGSGHVKWSDPAGKVVTTTSSTPKNGHRVAQETKKILVKHEKARVA